jgi:GTPase SAR1 family protein
MNSCFKIVVIGDNEVGKTSFIKRATMGIFDNRWVTCQWRTHEKLANGEVEDAMTMWRP